MELLTRSHWLMAYFDALHSKLLSKTLLSTWSSRILPTKPCVRDANLFSRIVEGE